MAETVAQSLSEELLSLLQKERFVMLSTMDHETGGPTLSALSWIYAPDSSTIRFAVDNRSRIVKNIKASPGVAIGLFGAGSVYSIIGNARVAVEKMEDVPLKLAMIEMEIELVRDVMFYGSRISTEPTYEKTYDPGAAAKLDNQVMASLKNTSAQS
ncbi:MAG: pyridoxamine 5'-phosphate oxidase family protein [Bacillaceae bacterium]|nr:pyridoxamine 5'-phosphate oxidase family protein [Bacillaceae bacterium]